MYLAIQQLRAVHVELEVHVPVLVEPCGVGAGRQQRPHVCRLGALVGRRLRHPLRGVERALLRPLPLCAPVPLVWARAEHHGHMCQGRSATGSGVHRPANVADLGCHRGKAREEPRRSPWVLELCAFVQRLDGGDRLGLLDAQIEPCRPVDRQQSGNDRSVGGLHLHHNRDQLGLRDARLDEAQKAEIVVGEQIGRVNHRPGPPPEVGDATAVRNLKDTASQARDGGLGPVVGPVLAGPGVELVAVLATEVRLDHQLRRRRQLVHELHPGPLEAHVRLVAPANCAGRSGLLSNTEPGGAREGIIHTLVHAREDRWHTQLRLRPGYDGRGAAR